VSCEREEGEEVTCIIDSGMDLGEEGFVQVRCQVRREIDKPSVVSEVKVCA